MPQAHNSKITAYDIKREANTGGPLMANGTNTPMCQSFVRNFQTFY
jgi:hypothetical protein